MAVWLGCLGNYDNLTFLEILFRLLLKSASYLGISLYAGLASNQEESFKCFKELAKAVFLSTR